MSDKRGLTPFAAGLGDMLPELAASLGVRRPVTGLAVGASEGVRMRDTLSDQGVNAALGLGIPLVGDMAARVVGQITGMASDFISEASRRGRGIDLPVTAGEMAPGGLVQGLEDAGQDIPFSGTFGGGPVAARQGELNRAANAAIGQTGDKVSKANLDAAAINVQEMSGKVDQKIGSIQIPDQVADRLREIYPRLRNRKAFKRFADFGEGGTNTLKVGEATDLWRRMVRQADTATDPNIAADIIEEVLPPLEDLITSKLGPDGTKAWRDYREMWRFHSILREGKSMTGGNVNPGALRQRLVRNDIEANLSNNYVTQNLQLKINWIFLDGFVFRSIFTDQIYSGYTAEFDGSYLLWNMSVGKKFLANKQAELELSVFDLLKQNVAIDRLNTESYIEETRTDVLQQFFMLTFTYTFKNFKGFEDRQPDRREGPGRGRW